MATSNHEEPGTSKQAHLSRYSTSRPSMNDLDYVPMLTPTPAIVGRTIIAEPYPTHRTRQATQRASSAKNSSALRPVSSALTQAVAKRRNSHEKVSPVRPGLRPRLESSAIYEQPIMWSPRPPYRMPQINEPQTPPRPADTDSDIEIITPPSSTTTPATSASAPTPMEEECTNYTLPRMNKQRVAHKPATIPINKQKRPRAPLGVVKKIPSSIRMRYLEAIIAEYLNTGHKEEESYEEALKEEQSLANRAANKSIYFNLVAGLKKKIREKAGVPTLPKGDDDPKYVNGNKVVSHSDILTGKVKGTFSIEKKRKSCDPAELNEYELYDRLMRYVVPIDQLDAYGYPSRDPDEPSLRKVPLGKDGQKQHLREELAPAYTCERCTKVYRLNPDGMPLETTGKCIYHPGHLWNERINRALEKRYSCCKGDTTSGGCSSNPYHVHKGELELANFQGYVETQPKPEREPNKHGIYALDCEMCYTTYGLELTRVTVINYKSDVVYEKLVKPSNPILDYNTRFSGIREGDLDSVETSLADVQNDLLKMFSSKTILIGHSLDSDMKALKIFHQRFIDTAQLFPHKRGLPFKRALRTLMVENLRVIIQEDVGHDSKEDACAAFRLVMWKAKTDVPEKTKS